MLERISSIITFGCAADETDFIKIFTNKRLYEYNITYADTMVIVKQGIC